MQTKIWIRYSLQNPSQRVRRIFSEKKECLKESGIQFEFMSLYKWNVISKCLNSKTSLAKACNIIWPRQFSFGYFFPNIFFMLMYGFEK